MTNILNIRREWRDCIEACSNCRNTCIEAAAYSLQEGEDFSDAHHIAMLYDCADICQASVNSMSRNSMQANAICRLCADICDKCAEHCEEYDDEQLDKCAQVCRTCAQQCRNMSRVAV
jgi:hypothetical protein